MAVVVVLMACAVSAQFPPGFNYNPFLYYPYTAQPAPVQETAEVVAARASHAAAHASARGARVIAAQPVPVWGQPGAVLDTPEVWAAKVEHYRAHSAAAAANGIMAYLPARYANMPFAMPQQVQETPEVAAARRAHLAAHALAAARVAKVFPVQPIPAPVPVWSQPVAVMQDTPEVHAAKLAFFRAFNEAAVRSG